ncbi:hypothetical protein ACFYE2_03625 [Kocuria sp. CPCC 205300]|uniref:hypothetical protein n=1 Tax=Kocuria sabuli TaxID=3071448 RepID=UPI0036DAC267
MPRLIDIRPGEERVPDELALTVGDVIRIAATGGRIHTGTAVEMLGVFTDSVVGTDGSILTPLGAPAIIMFRARQPGTAIVDIVLGTPFGPSETRSVLFRVES